MRMIFLAAVLCAMMIMALLPTAALADDGGQTELDGGKGSVIVTTVLSTGSVSFNKQALDTIHNNASSAVTLQLDTPLLTELTEQQQNTISNLRFSENVIVVKANLLNGDTFISDFGEGKATITVPYDKKTAGAVILYYIDSTGNMVEVESQYDPAAKQISFEVGHFSEYLVLESTSATLQTNRVTAGIAYTITAGANTGTARLIVSQYDENGKMLDAAVKLIDLSKPAELISTIPMVHQGGKYKAFLLDSSFAPLTGRAAPSEN